MLEEKRITDRISYIVSGEVPLSAEVGVIRGNLFLWLFDVGNGDETLKAIQNINGGRNIVLSHFHKDHVANMNYMKYQKVYASPYTCKHLKLESDYMGEFNIEDGVKIRIFDLPSSHAKGCVAMEIDGTYCFVGDAIYSAAKDGKPFYNAVVLKAEINVLKSIRSKYLLISHSDPFMRPKDEVIKELEEIYSHRDPHDPSIFNFDER